MKVGDLIKVSGEQGALQQVWVIAAIKTDARGVWVQFDNKNYTVTVWHDASFYEVINENR
jgi:hypothetical protein|tara:strand:- start:2674 stop:2853 length:180 start_codon:yes stop_codon:yes gene_type:complete